MLESGEIDVYQKMDNDGGTWGLSRPDRTCCCLGCAFWRPFPRPQIARDIARKYTRKPATQIARELRRDAKKTGRDANCAQTRIAT